MASSKKIKCSKELFKEVWLRTMLQGELADSELRILAYMSDFDRLGREEKLLIKKEFNLNLSYIYVLFQRLHDKGYITRVSRGVYKCNLMKIPTLESSSIDKYILIEFEVT